MTSEAESKPKSKIDPATRRWVAQLLASFAGQQNTLTIPRPYIELTGSVDAALALSQIIYWSDRTKDPDGWFAKSYAEWKTELGLSQYQMTRAVKRLKDMGVETRLKKFDGAPTLHYRLNKDRFSQWIMKKLDNGLSSNFTMENEVTSQSITEPTTEPIPEQKTKEKDSAPENGAGDVVVSQPVEEKPAPVEIKPLTEQQVLVGVTSKALDGLAYSIAPTYVKFFTGKTTPDDGEWHEHHIEPAMTVQEIRAFGLWLDDMYDFDQPLRKAKSISDWSARFRADEDHALYMKRSELTGLQEERERIEALSPKLPEPPTEDHREEVEARLKALAEKKRG